MPIDSVNNKTKPVLTNAVEIQRPPQRYYFVSYVINIGTPTQVFTYSAINYHPSAMFQKNNGNSSIISYQEITKGDYDLFKANQ